MRVFWNLFFILSSLLLIAKVHSEEVFVYTPVPTPTPFTFEGPVSENSKPVERGAYVREYFPTTVGNTLIYSYLAPSKRGNTWMKTEKCLSFEKKSTAIFECKVETDYYFSNSKDPSNVSVYKYEITDGGVRVDETESTTTSNKKTISNSNWDRFYDLKFPVGDRPVEWVNSHPGSNSEKDYMRAYFYQCSTEKKKYPDCIVVENYHPLGRLIYLKRDYYARSMGLVKEEDYEIDFGIVRFRGFASSELVFVKDPKGVDIKW